jgi:hypothetical protein
LIGRRYGIRLKKGNGECEHRGRNRQRKGEAMRKVAVIALVVMASIFLVTSALAESATKEECIAKCKEAAQLIVDKGQEAAL